MSFSYVIVANPAAGSISLDKKYRILKNVAKIIGAEIYGLDTTSKQEFRECIRMLCGRYNVIIAAGGDGTFSDLINSISFSDNIVGYLPMGTGNALRHALRYPRSVISSANKIRYGSIRRFDIIKYCDIQYAFMSSVGFEVEVIKEYQWMKKNKTIPRFSLYIMAVLRVLSRYIKGHSPLSAGIHINGKKHVIKDATSIIVTKQPYYGYGIKVMPHARFDDGLLHVGIFPPGIMNKILIIILSFSVGNIRGIFYSTKGSVRLNFSDQLGVHIDGDFAGNASNISFELMPKALQIIT